jgi:DNA-directed RNA polymerase subunit RPC12/RpoP
MPETYIVKCVECGATAQSLKPIDYWLCSNCKVKLTATPKKLLEHAAKAAKQNKEVKA